MKKCSLCSLTCRTMGKGFDCWTSRDVGPPRTCFWTEPGCSSPETPYRLWLCRSPPRALRLLWCGLRSVWDRGEFWKTWRYAASARPDDPPLYASALWLLCAPKPWPKHAPASAPLTSVCIEDTRSHQEQDYRRTGFLTKPSRLTSFQNLPMVSS